MLALRLAAAPRSRSAGLVLHQLGRLVRPPRSLAEPCVRGPTHPRSAGAVRGCAFASSPAARERMPPFRGRKSLLLQKCLVGPHAAGPARERLGGHLLGKSPPHPRIVRGPPSWRHGWELSGFSG